MKTILRIWSVRSNRRLRKKIADMVTEFCIEASVLITVLGILDSAISTQRTPSGKVFGLSLGLGALLFLTGCIIAMSTVAGELEAPEETEED